MASWDEHTPSPALKFEDSPAESFLSTPGDMYPSLFASSPSPDDATVNPMDMSTPASFREDSANDVLNGLSASGTPGPDSAGTAGEKKTTKKRKSWGQVLPEPKTNLPPRKRAKTEDEKEQRRVERVLRNRRAAQSSRERKRLEVEALEERNKELETMVLHLVEELNKARRDNGVVTRTSSSLDALRPAPVTLSPELFSSQDGHSVLEKQSSALGLLMSAQSNTVNPASLSPELSPVPDAESTEEQTSTTTPAPSKAAAAQATHDVDASPDLTQHPAEMLCEVDLQCQLAEASPRPAPWLPAAALQFQRLLAWQQLQLLLLASTSAILSVCQRPLTQIAMSLRAGFSLPPTLSILNTIIWLVTMSRRDPATLAAPKAPAPATPSRPSPPSTSSTSTSSSTTPSSPSSPAPAPSTHSTETPSRLPSTSTTSRTTTTRQTPTTLRLRSLRKILTCSPTLARPLTDATMAVLRLVSSEEAPRRHGVDQGLFSSVGVHEVGGANGGADEAVRAWWAQQPALPSREVLLTLLWALRVEEKRLDGRTTTMPGGNTGRAALKRRQLERESSGRGQAMGPAEGGAVTAGDGVAKRRRFA